MLNSRLEAGCLEYAAGTRVAIVKCLLRFTCANSRVDADYDVVMVCLESVSDCDCDCRYLASWRGEVEGGRLRSGWLTTRTTTEVTGRKYASVSGRSSRIMHSSRR